MTGHTPNEYFRIIRLKKAAELLLEGNYNVSEVSYKVGISDPLYLAVVSRHTMACLLLFICVERERNIEWATFIV